MALPSLSEIIALSLVAHQVAEEPRAPGHADPIAPMLGPRAALAR
jgi:hypothetical protein